LGVQQAEQGNEAARMIKPLKIFLFDFMDSLALAIYRISFIHIQNT